MSDYPKPRYLAGDRVRHARGGAEGVLLAAPDNTTEVPWTCTKASRYHMEGHHYIDGTDALRPVPSPDDVIEVTVKMTRAQRDRVANVNPDYVLSYWSEFIDACRASKEAEDA